MTEKERKASPKELKKLLAEKVALERQQLKDKKAKP